ncbi:bifunctional hydroxymethylpyrimidine kinase/phosphomethylpyrimidine kinase [Vibrio porteresiae]|uniref:hydroxymethylpyrimidine kinase n=1 Tax=Vibrio porteresiae DSM 19223 TaxID=1123496 RepID=A0ABZ0QHA7_9VIBR|nr:bifunctional hydroxymethylpyrimidine kinase/phosphomethylpyrimidine kinase [Vibrio porteresiae]WPC75195.1 bifunctional hydroxymethylpyrimidine kinase/phosphomethylpyrimidine kinase [Vibrio porteresiae DSM 19223]
MNSKTDISLSTPSPLPNILTIAGSDSGGGAGIQADIKTISANGGFACSVITAVTAQNSCGVTHIHPIPPQSVAAQLDAVLSDIRIDAIKIGMLPNIAIMEAVAAKLQQYAIKHVVIDPVMVATSGDQLVSPDAINTLCQTLFPLASLVTPNFYEAAIMVDKPFHYTSVENLRSALTRFDYPILLKGGHSDDAHYANDYLIHHDKITTFNGPRITTHNTHGTGCTLSAAIATQLALGCSLEQAIATAKVYLTEALRHSHRLQVGHGHGPVHHFYAYNATPVANADYAEAL